MAVRMSLLMALMGSDISEQLAAALNQDSSKFRGSNFIPKPQSSFTGLSTMFAEIVTLLL